ncbi:hypothetical protein QM565_27700 [Geitlerinema splendidum]|nr:hypothetical protein [Geitlerinema splendidum]
MAAALTRLPLIGKVYGVCCALLIAMLIAARFTPLYALSFISVSRESALYYRDMQRLQTVSVPLPAHVTQLAVSPDGTWIAYTDIRAGRYTLILNNLIHETQQVFPIEDGSITYLTWSPDSRSLAYQRDVLGTTGLFIYDVTRNQARQITDLWRCRSLAWSPDGGSLACNGFLCAPVRCHGSDADLRHAHSLRAAGAFRHAERCICRHMVARWHTASLCAGALSAFATAYPV